MKIGISSSNEKKCGVGIYARKFSEKLRETGITAFFDGVETLKGPLYYYRKGAELGKKYELLHVQFDYPHYGKFIASGIYAPLFYLALKQTKKPIITTIHDFTVFRGIQGTILNFVRMIIDFFVYNLSDKIIVPNQYAFQVALKKGAAKDKLQIIPLGTFLQRKKIKDAKRKLGLQGKKIIAVFGFILRHKDYNSVIQAVNMLNKNYLMLIAGGSQEINSSYEKELEKEIKENNLAKRVSITGFIPEDKLPLYFSAADYCILPYKSAVADSAILSQLIAYDKLVLATKLPGFTEINKKFNCMLLYSNTEDLYKKILSLETHKMLRKKLHRGILNYKKELAFENIIKKHLTLYRNLEFSFIKRE